MNINRKLMFFPCELCNRLAIKTMIVVVLFYLVKLCQCMIVEVNTSWKSCDFECQICFMCTKWKSPCSTEQIFWVANKRLRQIVSGKVLTAELHGHANWSHYVTAYLVYKTIWDSIGFLCICQNNEQFMSLA